MKAKTTRRTLIAGAAMLPALALPALAETSDAALLDLGRQLELAIKRNNETADPWHEQCEAYHERVETRIGWPGDHPEWSTAEFDAWLAVSREEADRSPAYKQTAADNEAASQVVDELCKRIIRLRPATLAGLGVLALATAAMFDTAATWNLAPNERDVDDEYATALVENALRLAGVALPFPTADAA